MKQRVGIARAFAIQPKMLLLDEPFGALDALTRGTIQDELLKIVRATHQTVFMITHDVDEAILLADKILLMSNGPRARDRRDRAQHAAAQPHARHDAPRPAVLPDPQPPGRLPREPLEAVPARDRASAATRAPAGAARLEPDAAPSDRAAASAPRDRSLVS